MDSQPKLRRHGGAIRQSDSGAASRLRCAAPVDLRKIVNPGDGRRPDQPHRIALAGSPREGRYREIWWQRSSLDAIDAQGFPPRGAPWVSLPFASACGDEAPPDCAKPEASGGAAAGDRRSRFRR